MKPFTYETLLRTNPCYSDERLRRLWGDREFATILDVLNAPIPNADKIYMVTHMKILPTLSAKETKLVAKYFGIAVKNLGDQRNNLQETLRFYQTSDKSTVEALKKVLDK